MSCSDKRKGGMRILLLGMLAGLALGLLLAPRPGAETLRALAGEKGKCREKIIRRLPV